jgi:hypothetical protein
MRRGSSRTVVGCHSAKFPCACNALAPWLWPNGFKGRLACHWPVPKHANNLLNCADAVLAGEGGLHAHRAPPSTLVQRIGRVSKRALNVPDNLRLSMVRVCNVCHLWRPLATLCYC